MTGITGGEPVPSLKAAGKVATAWRPLPRRLPRILLLSLVFSPDSVSTANLLTELALQLRRLGHDLKVFTTTPHYNQDPDVLAPQPLTPRWGRVLFQSDCQGIPVYHAWVGAKGSRVLGRLLDYLRFHAVGTIAGLRLGGRYDVVLAPSPPLTIGLSALVLAWARRVPFVYDVQEIYPDIAVDLGILRSRPLVRALEMLERFIYARSTAIVVISEGFRRRLLAKGVPEDKLHVIPNFVDTEFVKPGDRHNDFSAQHQLDGKFVVQYSGNLGLTQDLEGIISAAQMLSDLPEICFLIVGNGARKQWLTEQVADLRLANVRLLPYQPRGLVPSLYASSDVCVVPLRRGTGQTTFPSKIYTVMAAGRPAIVCADPGSDLPWIVQQAKCGFAVDPENPVALAEAIRGAYRQRDRLQEMGYNGREYVEMHHSPERIAAQYHELLMDVAWGKGREA